MNKLALTACVAILALQACANNDIEHRIDALVPIIGKWPPEASESQLASAKLEYDSLKHALDIAIADKPNDVALLLQRARLQAMGHNMDVSGAWDGAEADFNSALGVDPTNEDALLGIGYLYVNTGLGFAAKAEEFLRRAQAAHGRDLWVPAQKGLYFALTYQQNSAQALEVANRLVQLDPANKEYAWMRDMAQKSAKAP